MRSDPNLWIFDNSSIKTDSQIPLPETKLKKEKIGKRKIVYHIFDSYELDEKIFDQKHKVWADITEVCKGFIEIEYALTNEERLNIEKLNSYFVSVNDLIDMVTDKLLNDYGNPFDGEEKKKFTLALKTLAWQESGWQHYLKYKSWFFVILSKSTSNKLSDWGITQVARSGFKKKHLLNKAFFDNKGFCSISSTLYYGFLEYFYCYLNSREMPCNQSINDKLLGAYNRYVSGFSSCHNRYSQMDVDYGEFQKKVLGEFSLKLNTRPWEKHIDVK